MSSRVGVVGGMGPLATILFLSMVVEQTDAVTDQEHLDLDCQMHCSIPDRTAYILDHRRANPVPPIQADLRWLAERGAAFVVMPCNSAHYFFDELQASSPIPILNMLEIAAASVRKAHPDARKVAILGTRGTVQSGIYRSPCAHQGLQVVEVDDDAQRLIDTVVYDRVKAGVPVEEDLYLRVLDGALRSGADALLLACTELSVPERTIRHDLPTVDAMLALARATIVTAGKRLRGS
jgi:aspartate racemase